MLRMHDRCGVDIWRPRSGRLGRRRPWLPSRRAGSAMYIAVLSTALIVSLLGLAGLTLVRVERTQGESGTDRLIARRNARSAVELALRVIANDPDWRDTYADGQETTRQSLGPNGTGTVSWIVEDSDGSITNADTELRIKGIGRVGDTVQVSSIRAESWEGPYVLSSHTGYLLLEADDVEDDTWWCQFVRPDLPADAIGWRITSIEVYCRRRDDNSMLNVRIYRPLGNNQPSTTVIDGVDLHSSLFDPDMQWQEIEFHGTYSLERSAAVCIAFETKEEQPPIRLVYQVGLLGLVNGLISGPNWSLLDTTKSLLYRVHGVYTTADAELKPIMGTWVWDTAE